MYLNNSLKFFFGPVLRDILVFLYVHCFRPKISQVSKASLDS